MCEPVGWPFYIAASCGGRTNGLANAITAKNKLFACANRNAKKTQMVDKKAETLGLRLPIASSGVKAYISGESVAVAVAAALKRMTPEPSVKKWRTPVWFTVTGSACMV